MNNIEKLQLNKMISENNVEDQTNMIRKLKHSSLIKEDVDKMLKIINTHTLISHVELDNLCIEQCEFLFIHYPNIYTKLLKKEIDTSVLYIFIDTLKEIENNQLSQHEASFKIGKLLKQIYIDSALKHSSKLNNNKKISTLTPKKISWKEFKHIN
jgi:uncharacterized protein YlaN (UPF0358 family)